MSRRQRTAMLHLARCASYLPGAHPLDAAVDRRRRDSVRTAFINFGQRPEIESAKLTRSKKWRSVVGIPAKLNAHFEMNPNGVPGESVTAIHLHG
jgi:hypothetical protein